MAAGANEVMAKVIDTLQADETLVALLAASSAFARGSQPRDAAFPQITYEAERSVPGQIDDNSDEAIELTVYWSLWGYDVDTLREIEEALDNVLYDKRDMSTTNWTVRHCRRVAGAGSRPEPTELWDGATSRQMFQIEVPYLLKCRKK